MSASVQVSVCVCFNENLVVFRVFLRQRLIAHGDSRLMECPHPRKFINYTHTHTHRHRHTLIFSVCVKVEVIHTTLVGAERGVGRWRGGRDRWEGGKEAGG